MDLVEAADRHGLLDFPHTDLAAGSGRRVALRAVLRKARLPEVSAFQALTIQRSATIGFEHIGLAIESLHFLPSATVVLV